VLLSDAARPTAPEQALAHALAAYDRRPSPAGVSVLRRSIDRTLLLKRQQLHSGPSLNTGLPVSWARSSDGLFIVAVKKAGWLGTTAEQAALLRGFVEPDLVVLDDLFLARRISEASAELLQAVVHQRYKQRRSIVVTSNRVVQDWGKYLGDATMATTILDRLMHRAAMLEFEGKSYRLKEAASRIALNAVDCP